MCCQSIALLALLFAAPASATDSSAIVRQAVVAYEHGNYAAAIADLQALLHEYRLQSVDDIIQAHTVLGAAFFQLGDTPKAQEHFESLLNFSPSVQLDPVYYPPKMVTFLKELRTGRATPVVAKKSDGGWQHLDRNLMGDPATEQRERLYRWLPFGTGQFRNGEPIKGKVLLGVELLSLTASFAAALAYNNNRHNDGTFDDPAAAATYRDIFTVSLFSFGVVAVGGIADALHVYHRRQNQSPTVAMKEPAP